MIIQLIIKVFINRTFPEHLLTPQHTLVGCVFVFNSSFHRCMFVIILLKFILAKTIYYK